MATREVRIIEERALTAKRRSAAPLGLLLLCGATFWWGLGGLALVGPDEPRYAEVAREMFVTGDWISPRLAGCLWFEKPALYYWLAAGSYHLFGVGEFAARVPSALGATLAVLFVYFAVRRFVSGPAGLAVGAALATSGIMIGFGRAATVDMSLTAAMTAALLAGFCATGAEGRRRLWWWAACGAATGLAVLAKGLVGVVLVGAILGLFVALTGRWRAAGWRELGLCGAAFLAVAAAWYAPVTARHGWDFIDRFIIDHHFRRYTENRFSHPQPFHFYFLIAPLGLLPWTGFLVPALARLRRLRPRVDEGDALVALAWLWAGVTILFFSFSESKLPGYILPVFPALAVVMGIEVDRFRRGERGEGLAAAGWVTALLTLTVGVAFAVYAWRELGVAFNAAQWLPAGIGLLAAGLLVRQRRREFLFAAAAVVICAVVGTTVLLFPRLSETLSLRRLSVEAAAALRPGERIALYSMKEFAPVFYAEGRMMCGIGGGTLFNALGTERLVDVLAGEPSMVVFTESQWVTNLENDRRLQIERLGAQGRAVAVRLTLRAVAETPPPKKRRRATSPALPGAPPPAPAAPR